jgi:hypothetical protein
VGNLPALCGFRSTCLDEFVIAESLNDLLFMANTSTCWKWSAFRDLIDVPKAIVGQTQIFPSWIAFLGYALALILLLGGGSVNWIIIAFPLWVALSSSCILIQDR